MNLNCDFERFNQNLDNWKERSDVSMLGFDVFLCHRRSDGQPLALATREFLRRVGMSVFMDSSERKAGEFGKHLTNAVKRSTYLVALKTPDMFPQDATSRSAELNDDWVAIELKTASHSGTLIIELEQDPQVKLPEYIHPVDVIRYRNGALEDALRKLHLSIQRSPFSFLRGFFRSYRYYLIYVFSLLATCLVLFLALRVLQSTGPATLETNQKIQQQIDDVQRKIEDLESSSTTMLLIDTTSSMHNKLDRVIMHAEQMSLRDVPKEIIVVLFSDEEEDYIVKEWRRGESLESIMKSAVDFPLTSGGDLPEASGAAMMFARNLFIREEIASGQVVMFTDAPPHDRNIFIGEIRWLISSGHTVTLVSCDRPYRLLGWIEMEGISIVPLIESR